MASKKGKKSGSTSGKPATRTPAASTSSQTAATTSTTTGKRGYNRTPVLQRAAKLVLHMSKKHAALDKMASKWHGENETESQTDSLNMITDRLRDMGEVLADISTAVTSLTDSGFKPVLGSPGRKPLAAGDAVAFKADKYDPVAHGSVNAFVVVATTDKYVMIRPEGDSKTTPLPVSRAWIVRRTDSDADAIDTDAA